MILLTPCVLASMSPAAFVGCSNEDIDPWLTGPWNWVAVQDEALFSTDKSRPFRSSAFKRRKRAALPPIPGPGTWQWSRLPPRPRLSRRIHYTSPSVPLARLRIRPPADRLCG